MKRGTPAAFAAQKFLAGLRYPASKEEVIAHARSRGAGERVMHALHHLPERAYESPITLSSEIGRQAERAKRYARP